jgi:hypothetical protein
MSSAFQVDGLLIKISKNRCFANEIALSANGGKNRAKNPANGQGGRYSVNSFI